MSIKREVYHIGITFDDKKRAEEYNSFVFEESNEKTFVIKIEISIHANKL